MMHITVSSHASKATVNWHGKIKNRIISEEFSRKMRQRLNEQPRRRLAMQKCFCSQCLPGKEMWATFGWINDGCRGKSIPKGLSEALNVQCKSMGKKAAGVRKPKLETGRIFSVKHRKQVQLRAAQAHSRAHWSSAVTLSSTNSRARAALLWQQITAASWENGFSSYSQVGYGKDFSLFPFQKDLLVLLSQFFNLTVSDIHAYMC